VFGIPAHNPVIETTPGHPLEAYGRAKLRAELLCRDAVDSGVDVTITGKLVPTPRTRRAVLLPGGAHDAADDAVGRPSGAGD